MTSRSGGASEFNRDNVIIDGFLKHRETGLVNRWRHRYVVFKIASAGRLTFTIYKNQPATHANEISEIPIEEYGGLDCTLKVDGEKHVFAIITTSSTECFAAESSDKLQDWSSKIKEYLGKELILNIAVPYKQNVLKAGRGQIRIRNTGFTITTNEVPPKCQGSWQMLHIRKFGYSDQFRFETGSRCPSGEYLYVITTEDNEKMNSVFTDLSQHKPIFRDDRMGRRMTQEHEMLRKIRSHLEPLPHQQQHYHQQLGMRRSLQHNDGNSYYENHTSMTTPRRTSAQADPLRPRSNAVLNQPYPTTEGYYNLQSLLRDMTSSSSKRANSDPPEERLYYNQVDVTRNLNNSESFRKRLQSPTSDDSDDDFVDVQEIIDNDTSTATSDVVYCNLQNKQEYTQTNYENLTPTHKAKSSNDNDTHLYTNVTIPTNSVIEVTSAPNSPPSHKRLTPPTNSDEIGSHSDSENSDSSIRNRTTSVVDNLIISADHASKSCEDIPKLEPLEHKAISDNETVQRNSPSPLGEVRISKNRPSVYDHLVPVKRTVSNALSNESNTSSISNDTNGTTSNVGSSDVGKKMKPLRRQHTYEDVDLPDVPRSSSTSPEQSQDSYNRKIEVLGHGHSYEYIEVKSVVQQIRSTSPHTAVNAKNTKVSEDEVPVTISDDSSPRHKKKPVPTPRKITKPTEVNATNSSSYTVDDNNENYLINKHTQRHISPHHRPYPAPAVPPKAKRSISGPGNESTATTLPPQYRSHLLNTGKSSSATDVFSTLESRRGPYGKGRLHSEDILPLANYVPVTVTTHTTETTVDLKQRDTSAVVNYTDINHFLTRQIQTMREEREIEKGLV